METEHLHRLIDEKKWTFILRELDERISRRESFEDHEAIVWLFESLDKNFREEHAQNHYFVMWKIAYKAGKIKLAKNYAEFILDYLVSLKRVPAIKKLVEELSAEGIFKTHEKFQSIDFILGKKGNTPEKEMGGFATHPEMWKDSKETLKSYLVMENSWSVEQWKLLYEYILKFYYDKDIFLMLAEKAHDLKKTKHRDNILAFLSSKKVSLKAFKEKITPEKERENDSSLNVDYDQLAMDVISGVTEPSVSEQRRIIVSVNNLSSEELLEKGKDMVVAFGLLGMDKVVVKLCERLVPLLKDASARAGILFMMAQALYNSNDYYKAIDVISDAFGSEPLVSEEALAFNYLKAESLLKLKKYKQAHDLFSMIKKENPQYRLVGERLRHIEEIK